MLASPSAETSASNHRSHKESWKEFYPSLESIGKESWRNSIPLLNPLEGIRRKISGRNKELTGHDKGDR
jgi:hypothetical protein